MKIIRLIIIVFISFFCSVLNVYAQGSIITNILIKDTGGSVYTETPSINENIIEAKTIFKEINDSVTYQISLDFDNTLYKFGSVTDSNQNENIETSYTFFNDKIFMSLNYKNEIDSFLELDDITVQTHLVDIYDNPVTKSNYTLIFVLSIILITVVIIICIKYKKNKFLFLFLLLFPIVVISKEDVVIDFVFSGQLIKVGCDVHFGDDDPMDSILCVYGEKCEVPEITYTKDNQFLIGWTTVEGGDLVYEAEELSLIKNGLSMKNVTLYPVWSDNVIPFPYTGSSSIYTIHRTGSYKLEVWGAQGGSGDNNNGKVKEGGKGGYSRGVIYLSKETVLYIYPGGQGNKGRDSDTVPHQGGFNGGGASYGSNGGRGSGGGASDIRVGNDSLYARVIVAGGGSGGWTYSGEIYDSNAGGGNEGETSYASSESRASGGTQISGGSGYGETHAGWSIASFGLGGGREADCQNNLTICGGGGGWYGGGAGNGAGGGSGWVYTEDAYNYWANNSVEGASGNWLLDSSYYLSDAETISGLTSFPSPDGESEIGHSGNGYVRITYLG